MTIEDETQLEVKSAERVKWIENEIIGPATALIEALNRDNDFQFLRWPTPELSWLDQRALGLPADPPTVIKRGTRLYYIEARKRVRKITHRDLLVEELTGMRDWARKKTNEMRKPQRPSRKPRTRWRYELVHELLLVRATRRVYGTSQSQGEFPDFVRAAARPLLGRFENLDAQLREAIARHKPLTRCTEPPRLL